MELKRKVIGSKRILVVGILFSIVFMALVSRLIYVMIINGASYKQLALTQWTKTIKTAPKRGSYCE